MRIANSQPRPLPGAVESSQSPNPEEVIQATIVMNPRSPEDRGKLLENIRQKPPKDRRILDFDEYERTCGADPDLFRAVQDYSVKSGLEIVQALTSLERRAVAVSGKLSTFSKAFDVKFSQHEDGFATHRTFTGHIDLPDHIHGAVQYVLGLDDRSVAHPHLFLRRAAMPGGPAGVRRAAVPRRPGPEAAGVRAALPPQLHPVKPETVAQWYDFPDEATGEGQCIGIVILSSGFRLEDVEAYFKARGLPTGRVSFEKNQPASHRMVDKWWESAERAIAKIAQGQNAQPATTGNEQDDMNVLWTVESTMDLELAGALAPSARLMAYFGSNDAQGKYHAFTRALTDREHSPSVLSCSWGADENEVDAAELRVLDHVLEDAGLRGITVCCASGDTPGLVSYPASSPQTLSCGGTHAVYQGGRLQETVWKEAPFGSGGGVSGFFSETPPWQEAAKVAEALGDTAGRGDPDVAAKADMLTGYEVLIYGDEIVSGGTSAAAPLWAALIARLNQRLGRPIGYLNPLLYSDAFKKATQPIAGQSTRWAPATGLGTPNGRELLKALSGASGVISASGR